jgi:hypothetical protein
MKRNLTSLLALSLMILLSFQAQAQDLSLGVRAGLNIMNANLDNVEVFGGEDAPRGVNESYSSLAGFNGAIFLDIRFSDFFAIQPEFLIHQKGGSYVANYNASGTQPINASYDIRLLNLEVPVLAKISAGDVFWRVSALLGPGFGYAAGGRYEYVENGSSGKDSVEFGSTGDRLMASFHAGLGLEIDLGRGWFYADGRYQFSFGESELEFVGDAAFSNFALSIGYSMPLYE